MGNLTLKQKIALCSGKNEWYTKDFSKDGVPSVMMSDGPNGLRKQEGSADMLGTEPSKPATCYPTASIAACSFDRALLREYGESLGQEAKAENIALVLGPGVNIKRNPLCGRNFEYFSEDPYLAGQMGQAYVEGVQSTGTGACVKHFACNSQEYFRMTSDSLVDERTLREIYLSAFENVIKTARPSAIMGAYNKINGTYCCSDKKLLTDILRDDWGYEGMVVTDWTAIEDRADGFRAGCDLVMPGGNAYGEKEVLKAVENGELDQKLIERSAERVRKFAVNAAEKLKISDVNTSDSSKPGKAAPGNAAPGNAAPGIANSVISHHETARKIAEHSAVLLKNDGNVLPVKTFENACFIGFMAEEFRYQGYGSSKINPTKLEQVRELYPDVPYAKGYNPDGSTTEEMVEEAVRIASKSENIIVFAGLPGIYESEGYDRKDMKIPEGHNRLIEKLIQICKENGCRADEKAVKNNDGINNGSHKAGNKSRRIIVVLAGGSSMELPWADDVDAILYMGLAGQAGAGAAMRLLLGEVNPSGKLAENWVYRYEDAVTSSFYCKGSRDAQYREGIYVGYRYYEKAGIRVRFPFGYGLSYTTFEYSDLKVDRDARVATVKVKNTGTCEGEEISLLYIGYEKENCYRPLRELKGFEKTTLKPGEEKEVSFRLDDRCFAIWDDGWKIPCGDYSIQVTGSPLEDGCIQKIPVDKTSRKLEIPFCNSPDEKDDNASAKSETRSVTRNKISSWYLNPSGAPSEEDFLTIYDKPLPVHKIRPFDLNSNIYDMLSVSPLLRLIYKIYERKMAKQFGRGTADYRGLMIMADECPVRSVQNNLAMKHHAGQAFADLGNKKYFSMIKHFLG